MYVLSDPWNTQQPDGLSFESGWRGLCAVLHGPWRDEYASQMKQRDASELILNYARGMRQSDLSFLDRLTFIRSLELLTYDIADVSAIHCLSGLQRLILGTRDKTPVNFTYFPNLLDVGFSWRPNCTSLFGCRNLQRLSLRKYPETGTEPFGSLSELDTLSIVESRTQDLQGLSSLHRLRELTLGYLPALQSLEPLQDLTSLRKLRVEGCKKVRSVEPVGRLADLEAFDFTNCGPVETITPLKSLTRLRRLALWGTTEVLDGNMAVIRDMHNLEDVSFNNRRHYNARVQEFIKSEPA